MKFKVQYSSEALDDLRALFEYIANELQAPETATAQYRRISEAVKKLDEMPTRFPLYQYEPWFSEGMRWLPVDNYLVFFFSDEKLKTVSVARIMYKGRDVKKQLSEQ